MTGIINGFSYGNSQIEAVAKYNNSATLDTPVDSLGRGDCTALVDINENAYINLPTKTPKIIAKEIMTVANAETGANKYTALFAPYVTYDLAYPTEDGNAYYTNTKFPASFHYLACAITARENFAEWYAVAGYTRGTSAYSIKSVGIKLGEVVIDLLQPRNIRSTSPAAQRSVNLVVVSNNGYFMWGNRTAELLGAQGGELGDL